MATLPEKEKLQLLHFARSVIAAELGKTGSVEKPSDISPVLKEKRGCFVTLHKKGALRGCIGTIEPVQPLLLNIQENAINAAFRDPRFAPLTVEELPAIDLEISILTPPEPLSFKDSAELLEKLKPGVHGVILSKGFKRSTFLPQVWEQLPQKKEFLRHLCLKAGLDDDCWRSPGIMVQVYEVEFFGEK